MRVKLTFEQYEQIWPKNTVQQPTFITTKGRHWNKKNTSQNYFGRWTLAQLNGTLLNLPNPTLFLDTIYLQEAKASSEVENIITTNDELYKSLVAGRKVENPATKEVLRYKEALWLGLEQLNKKPFITTNLCISIVQCIKQNTASIRVTPGTTLSNTKGKVIYTPPCGRKYYSWKIGKLRKIY